MPRTETKGYPPRETKLLQDRDPLSDLTFAPNSLDEKPHVDRPTTCHEAKGWRAEPPAKP